MAQGEDEKRMCLSSTRLLQIGGYGDFAGEQVVHQAGFLFLEFGWSKRFRLQF
jgi:hypothetical protein